MPNTFINIMMKGLHNFIDTSGADENTVVAIGNKLRYSAHI